MTTDLDKSCQHISLNTSSYFIREIFPGACHECLECVRKIFCEPSGVEEEYFYFYNFSLYKGTRTATFNFLGGKKYDLKYWLLITEML